MSKSNFRLISNNICYGPAPAFSDEVEQHLTVSTTGQVWFSARNYLQYTEGRGFCRRKQLNIGLWKAEFLMQLISRLEERPMVTDCGDYDLLIRLENGTTRKLSGSLIGDDLVPIYGGEISLSKLLRRYIPVYGLWGFDGSLSPDYEGRKAIHLFAKKWINKFSSPNLSTNEFEDCFGTDCIVLGFQMDGGHQFEKLYPHALHPDGGNFDSIVSTITDIDILGSAVFSQYRYLTHWSFYPGLDEQYKHWFIMALQQLCLLTKKN